MCVLVSRCAKIGVRGSVYARVYMYTCVCTSE